MNTSPEIFDQPVILLGGGDVNLPLLQLYVDLGWPLIAADGAANALTDTDIVPDLIIGDMDSLASADHWAGKSRLLVVKEQDTTDFEKCLYLIDAPSFVGFGFLGQRLDHSLTSLHVLAKYSAHKTVLLVDMSDAVFVTSRAVSLELPVGSRVSVFPLGPVRFEASIGLEFPLDGVHLDIGAMSGTSNRSTQASVSLRPVADNTSAFAVIVDAAHHQLLRRKLS